MFGLLVASALVAAPSAGAQERVTGEAQAAFEGATGAFDRGDYETAVTGFQRAYELTGHPDVLFNVYSAAERWGRLDLAVGALERYLAEADIEADRRPVLRDRLARLRERLAAEAVPEEASAREDASDHEASDDEASDDGASDREASDHQASDHETGVQAGGDDRDVQDPDAAPGSPAPGGGVHPAGVGVLIGAGVLAVSFGVFAALSEVEDGNLETRCGAPPGCGDDALSTLEAFNIVADVSWIGAAALAVAGVVLLFALPPEDDPTEPRAALVPWASPNAGGVAMVGRY